MAGPVDPLLSCEGAGVVVMRSYSFPYGDAVFSVGDKVMVMIRRYDFGRKQIYGETIAKW